MIYCIKDNHLKEVNDKVSTLRHKPKEVQEIVKETSDRKEQMPCHDKFHYHSSDDMF